MTLHQNIRSADPRANHPDAYTAPAQPAAEDEVADFLWGLTRLLHPDHVLETGTAFGHTAARIAQALQQNGHGVLHTLEPKPNRHAQATQRLAGLPVVPTLARFEEWTPPPDARYGLCFFDADRHHRDQEYRRFEPWMTSDALLVFHDCGAQHPARECVTRLEAEGLIVTLFVPTPRGVCLAQRL